jgi:dienelactone hydrolase
MHFSDQDYYSLPRWNQELANRVRAHGGSVSAFDYPQNTHALEISNHEWFQQGEVVPGFDEMVRRDQQLFREGRVVDPMTEDKTSIAALRRYAGAVRNEFTSAYEREPLGGLDREVVRFTADGLEQYALVVEPAGEPPEHGWPVLLMSHGYHPEPRKNGRRADGITDRPGDYYRGLPAAFARAGFLVVWPDYRGHNISQGIEFTRQADAALWYARDVVAAFAALGSLPRANTESVFLWGHSMGGGITLRAALALGDRIRGASIWSGGTIGSSATPDLELLTAPLHFQHALSDATTPSTWSVDLHSRVSDLGKPADIHLFETDQHFFTDKERDQAIELDLAFFRQLMAPM